MLFAPILFALEDGLGLTEDGLREQLAGQCKAAGSIAAWSREHGLCDEQVGAFIRGKRPPEPKLLTALGMTTQRFYRAAPL